MPQSALEQQVAAGQPAIPNYPGRVQRDRSNGNIIDTGLSGINGPSDAYVAVDTGPLPASPATIELVSSHGPTSVGQFGRVQPDPRDDGPAPGDPYDWRREYFAEHSARHRAVQEALRDLMPGQRALEVYVRGGGPGGRRGFVDVVQWGDARGNENAALFWEVKPYTPNGRATGPRQLSRYVRAARADKDWEGFDVQYGGHQPYQFVPVERTDEILVAFNLLPEGAEDSDKADVGESIRYYVTLDRLREDEDLQAELRQQRVLVDQILEDASSLYPKAGEGCGCDGNPFLVFMDWVW